MKLKIMTLLFCLLLPAISFGADDVEALFNKALDQLVRKGYGGDTSAEERYLQAVLEQEPKHLEASWLLIYIRLVPLQDASLSERSVALSAVAPAFARLAKLTNESKKQAFLHYVTAIYAGYYDAYERALLEIDKALALEPKSSRYLVARGRILMNYGAGRKQDADIEKGIDLIRKAKELAKTQINPYISEALYDFYIAWGVSELSQPRWKEVVEHYLRFIEQSEKYTPYAFAWNNVSIAYRHLGQCAKAKEAAENALKVMKFGAAQSNKRYAEFCLEMQKMGTMEKTGKE